MHDPELASKRNTKELKFSTPPSYASELAFLMANLLFLKLLVNEQFFEAMTFFKISLPLLAYLIFNIFMNLHELLQLMHIEALSPATESVGDADESQDQLISPKQLKKLIRISRDMLFYFGVYFFTGQLDQVLVPKEELYELFLSERRAVPAAVLIELGLLMQVWIVRGKRGRILEAKIKAGLMDSAEANQAYYGLAGLSTFFNALTQTTTTLCANGQCFTIYSNAIASNLAAFGVTVTQISAILVPLCCLLLLYTVWSLYRQRRDWTYKPF